ncbi:MAG TPA: sugar phosphate isomerase/epimerase [Bryobacteraceae bacterium]|nr:sugar phosphate isomerase/epimerase [Bryobacteraceae bacterium]
MRRREFLATIPAVALAKERHVRLGVGTGVYQAHPMAEAARMIKAAGFSCVHLAWRFADVRFDPYNPDWSYPRRARDVFGEAGLRIDAVYGYVSLVHPDPDTRARNVRALIGILEHARDFGTPNVATETGSFHPNQRNNPLPDDPAAGWKQFIGTIRELAKVAESAGAQLAVEPSLATSLGTVEDAGRMLHEVPSPNLKILWDAAHVFNAGNIRNMKAELNKAYRTFGSKVVHAHANDARLEPDGTVKFGEAGSGQLDYTTYIALLEKLNRDVSITLEHCQEADIPRVRDYVAKFL